MAILMVVWCLLNSRCDLIIHRFHGGLSTGPLTEAGKAHSAEAACRNLERARAALHLRRHPPTANEKMREMIDDKYERMAELQLGAELGDEP